MKSWQFHRKLLVDDRPLMWYELYMTQCLHSPRKILKPMVMYDDDIVRKSTLPVLSGWIRGCGNRKLHAGPRH